MLIYRSRSLLSLTGSSGAADITYHGENLWENVDKGMARRADRGREEFVSAVYQLGYCYSYKGQGKVKSQELIKRAIEGLK